MTTTTIPKISTGDRFEHTDDRGMTRIIEIIAAPTLSSPVGYRVVRNDTHPHRVGRTASIRVADLHRKYEAVAA